MKREPAHVDEQFSNRASTRAMRYIKDARETASNLLHDPGRDSRLEAMRCIVCFYTRRHVIAGHAVTIQPCGICKTSQVYGSTATDVLCDTCAKVNGLCKHCGADMSYQTRGKGSGL